MIGNIKMRIGTSYTLQGVYRSIEVYGMGREYVASVKKQSPWYTIFLYVLGFESLSQKIENKIWRNKVAKTARELKD